MNVAARGGRLVRRRAGGTAGPGTPASLTVDATRIDAGKHGSDTGIYDRKGRRVLTRERLHRFYNGSLFYELADEVAARRAHARTGLLRMVAGHVRELY